MINDNELRSIIEKVILDTRKSQVSPKAVVDKPIEHKVDVKTSSKKPVLNNSGVKDLGLVVLEDQVLVDNPENPEELKRMRKYTPARIAVGRAGTRYKTETILRFRADHAVAQDSVFTDVSEEFLTKMKLEPFITKCKDRNEFLTRPDLGREFDQESLQRIASIVEKDAQVLIYVADGLSSIAIENNALDVLPILRDGLISKGIKVATPFFVKYGRVATMDYIGDVVNASVICLLVGERPGLVTAGSMSAYFAYKPTVGMPESRRTVLSNIHKGGTPPVEAGAHLVDIIKKSLDAKASGLDLKL